MNHFNQICHIQIEWLRFIRTFRFDLRIFSELNWFRFNSKYQNEFLFFYIVYIVTAGRGYTTSFRHQDSLTAQKMKVSIKDFFSKCDQIRRKSYNKRHLRTLDLSSKFEYIFICSICGGASHKISGKHDRKTLVHGLFENASFLKKITFSLFNIKKN